MLIDVVSGEIKPLEMEVGNSRHVGIPADPDSVIASTDESYFNWPVLPEAPSSLNVSATGNAAKLTWEVHGGDSTGVVVERRNDGKGGAARWEKVAQLAATASEYTDASYRNGLSVSYRVRAVNNEREFLPIRISYVGLRSTRG